jgi:hypothetical protein
VLTSWFLLRPRVFGQKTTFLRCEVLTSSHIAKDSCAILDQNEGEARMRPWIIMGSAAVIALIIAAFMTIVPTALAPVPTKPAQVHQFIDSDNPSSSPLIGPGRPPNLLHGLRGSNIRTTVEEQGGVKLNPNAAESREWGLGCVAILTAPKSMRVGEFASVETTLLVAAGQDEIAGLLQAAKDTQTAINAGSPASDTDPHTGLDPPSADALRRMVDGNSNRQAAVDTLPGSPIITAHLAGPGFDLTPVTPERQGMTGKQPGHWQWTIKALDPGPRTLTVSYSAEVEVAGQRVPQALRTLSRDVVVNVAATGFLKAVDETTKSLKSIAESASWFWTTLILPALMFLYGLRKWFRERHA